MRFVDYCLYMKYNCAFRLVRMCTSEAVNRTGCGLTGATEVRVANPDRAVMTSCGLTPCLMSLRNQPILIDSPLLRSGFRAGGI